MHLTSPVCVSLNICCPDAIAPQTKPPFSLDAAIGQAAMAALPQLPPTPRSWENPEGPPDSQEKLGEQEEGAPAQPAQPSPEEAKAASRLEDVVAKLNEKAKENANADTEEKKLQAAPGKEIFVEHLKAFIPKATKQGGQLMIASGLCFDLSRWWLSCGVAWAAAV